MQQSEARFSPQHEHFDDILVYVIDGPGRLALVNELKRVNRKHGYDDVLPDPPDYALERNLKVLRHSKGV